MSDPQPVPGRRVPRRAEPLQPDRPAQGNDAESPADGSDATAGKQKRQSDEALKNVSEGYD